MADDSKAQDTGQAAYGNSGETPAGNPDPNDTHRTDTGIGTPSDKADDAAAAQGSDGGGELGS